MTARAQTIGGKDTYQTDPPQLGALLANVGPITITETVIRSATIPSGAVLIGTAGITLRFSASGVVSNTTVQSTWTLRVRIGTTTLTGAIVAADTFLSGTLARTNAPCRIDGEVTIRTVGASGTATGHVQLHAAGLAAGGTGLIAPVIIDTTTASLVELTAIGVTGTPSLTIHTATIEVM